MAGRRKATFESTDYIHIKMKRQGLCKMYKNNPCLFVYRVKNTIG